MHEESRNSVPHADQNEPAAELIQHHDLPKEDAFAWLQTLGAFVLNLNTWYVLTFSIVSKWPTADTHA